MDSKPPGKNTGREIVERTVEAALGSVPLVGAALAVTFVTALGWQLERRREEWFTQLAEGLEGVRQRIGDLDFETLAENPVFVDAVVSATRTIEHTHQEEKIAALRNAVLNSVGRDAPDADTQEILLGLIDRLTKSHLRFLTLWNDPAAWFESHDLEPPQAGLAGSRIQTVEAGMPETRGRQDFIRMLSHDLNNSGLMTAEIAGMVSPTALMDRLTSELGSQLVRHISPPQAQ
jgi:hypothetical protein